jgi:two-component system response regulator DesR
MGALQTGAQWLRAERLRVAVCGEEAALLNRVCAAVVAGGHHLLARDETVDGLLAHVAGSVNGDAPACVVVGADRPDRSAVSTVRSIRTRLEGTPAVLVCERARGTEIRRALELGMDGVVLADELEAALAAVVSVVCAGQISVPRGQRGEVRARALTTRERQVLALVIAGLTNAQIAAKLFLAESTVKSHLSSAFAKLGVSSRNEAASLILDPERGAALGIRTGASERVPLQA